MKTYPLLNQAPHHEDVLVAFKILFLKHA